MPLDLFEGNTRIHILSRHRVGQYCLQLSSPLLPKKIILYSVNNVSHRGGVAGLVICSGGFS